MIKMDYQKQFASPSSEYRGKPFWAWNGPLDEAELRRQIRVFKEMGLGGAFMHSRVGLATPYLSEEWFNLVNACVEEAKSQEMEAWLYDEDRWPSGAAGGLVTQDKRYRMRELLLTIEKGTISKCAGDELAIFLAKMDGSRLIDVRRVDKDAHPAPDDTVLLFRCRMQAESRWYNGQTYLDMLNEDAVKEFIRVTHEAYKKHTLSKYGADQVPGIFTDEPNYGTVGAHHGQDRVSSPWTDRLPELFKDRYGYDLMDHLPELFFNMGDQDFSKVRHDYIETLTHLFASNFGGLIGKWCQENGVSYTGHVLAEENLISQSTVVGSAMRFYEHMQAPGIDILCGQGLTRAGGTQSEYSTAKQCASVHHQFGRKWMLSELYGCTGWGFTFSEQKAVGDWQAALGVNLRCQHLSWYTMLGEAKRDYPASISFQSPWWRSYSRVEDYFARVGVLMTCGEPIRDLAVIHPVESVWGVMTPGPGNNPKDKAHELNSQFMAVQNALLAGHYDFDYVEEDIFARHGGVEQGILKVAKAKYKAVLVPPAITLRESTIKLLNNFHASGGKVLFVEPIPTLVQGISSDAARNLAKSAIIIPADRSTLLEELGKLMSLRRVSIKTADGQEYPHALYMLRKSEDDRWFLFIVHTLQDVSSGPLTVTIPGTGQAQEWDAATGETWLAEYSTQGDSVVIKTDLPGVGSRLFILDPKSDASLVQRPIYMEVRRESIHQAAWPILRNEPNAIPLDMAEYAINYGEWQGPDEILRIDRAVRDAGGLPHRSGDMVQPWAQTEPPSARPIKAALRFRFKVEALPSGPCHLVMENPEKFFVSLNGHTLKADQDEGWWIDNSLRRILISPSQLEDGENVLVLETEYHYNSNLESLYLCGEFGVRLENRQMTLTELPATLKLGDWTSQGFPFYSGAVSYTVHVTPEKKEGERIFIEIPHWEGVLLNLRVNGLDAGIIGWPEYELDITDAINHGNNRLEIEVVSSRRNLMGPLHCANPRLPWTGPGQFVTTGEMWTDNYVLFPYGLTAAPVLSMREKI
jgi:hypothetical protein